jgi:uncharacterized protein (UPF0332 family)
MDFNDCIEKGFIKPNERAKQWVTKELQSAKKFLDQAESIMTIDAYESAELIGYSAIFHSARALLYSKGYTERSHYCLFTALLKLYSAGDTHELLKEADKIRVAKHDIAYGGRDVLGEEVEHSLKVAKRLYALANKEVKT